MPLFEYECLECGREFEAFVTAERLPACPACAGAELRKRLSSPGIVGRTGRAEAAAVSSCAAQGGACACSHGNN